MDGSGFSVSDGSLKGRLAERLRELDLQITAERLRATPDEALIRRLSREKLLARDRVAALGGCAMPRWARDSPNP
ncbi:hypothetical protein [Falsiroseomonas sp. E2-1-a20]|uniref:hypothetical protein n=1 Tax=Falsiroseomonas sp. E2-1-a20 TaxID=3239300 RepID=UPI003F3F52A9